MIGKVINMTGKRFGRLYVVKEIGRLRGAALFLCKCDCGNTKKITGIDLRSGRVNSCGCLKKELITKKNTTHNLTNSRLYSIYYNMMSRCTNKNSSHFSDYGGRGIKICNEWKDNFLNFYNWAISHGYSDNLSIDRIDVNGNYEPSNCRWATNEIQCNNKRDNIFLTYNGETKTLT